MGKDSVNVVANRSLTICLDLSGNKGSRPRRVARPSSARYMKTQRRLFHSCLIESRLEDVSLGLEDSFWKQQPSCAKAIAFERRLLFESHEHNRSRWVSQPGNSYAYHDILLLRYAGDTMFSLSISDTIPYRRCPVSESVLLDEGLKP